MIEKTKDTIVQTVTNVDGFKKEMDNEPSKEDPRKTWRGKLDNVFIGKKLNTDGKIVNDSGKILDKKV